MNLKFVAAALCLFPIAMSAYAIAKIAQAGIDAKARNNSTDLGTLPMFGIIMCESLGLFCLVCALLIIFGN
jgi:F0F1-type ATP synthase membrane subunit c/vacuolar-type H+-ATPase subunit K